MKYVLIRNKGSTHRKLLEKLGAGTSSGVNDRSVTGQFSSGFKMATIVALRMGLKVIVSSVDEFGPYTLTFETRDDAIYHDDKHIILKTVYYRYSEDEAIETSFVLTAFPRWNESVGDDDNKIYPILREYILNAKDKDSSFDLSFGLKKTRSANQDETLVYVEQTRAISNLLKKSKDRYFKLWQPSVFKVDGAGAVYVKTSKETRLFCSGFLAGCSEEILTRSRYDYNLDIKSLVGEDRRILSESGYQRQLGLLFTQIDDRVLLRSLIQFACSYVFTYEADAFVTLVKKALPENFKKLCIEIWQEIYGENAVIESGDSGIDVEVENILNFSVVKLNPNMKAFLKHVGIKDARRVYSEEIDNVPTRALTEVEAQRLVNIIKEYLLPIKYYQGLVKTRFVVCSSRDKVFAGKTDYKIIFIEEGEFEGSDYQLLQIVVHEYRHIMSKKSDSQYRELMIHADQEQSHLLGLLRVALCALRETGVEPSDIYEEFIKLK